MAEPGSTRVAFGRGDVVERKYEVESLLGVGTMGATYLARHISSGRQVALKFFDPELLPPTPESRGRMDLLFKQIQNVRHAGLVRYGEQGQHNGVLYVTMEHFPSQSLRELIRQYHEAGKAFTLQEACAIAIKVLEALQAAHQAGLVHRVLRPENVLVHTETSGPGAKNILRTVKVTDLALASISRPADMVKRLERKNATAYLAPELAGFGEGGTAQADIYSVGVLLYELLCGQTPTGTFLSPTQLREDLPEHIDQIVELALAPNPEDRYPTAADMATDIQRSFQLEMIARSTPTTYRNVLIALGFAVVVVAGLAGYQAVREKDDPILIARAADDQLRKEVAAANPLPTEEEVRRRLEAHREMVFIPSGTFVRGRLNQEDPLANADEPLAEVIQVPAFYVDRHEFPNRFGQAPVAKVTWKKAEETCKTFNKRLCSADEWEKACKGPPNFIYSYGDTWDASFCGGEMSEPYTAGSRTDCISYYGVHDMSGGMREWTGTEVTISSGRYVVKGGQRGNPEKGTRCAYTVDEDGSYSDNLLSFRCCLDAEP